MPKPPKKPQRRIADRRRTDAEHHGPLAMFIAGVVTIVWAISVTVDSFSTTYSAPAEIHGVMLAAVGAILGRGWIIMRRNGSDE